MRIEANGQLLPAGSAKPQAALATHFSALLNPRDAAADRNAQSDEQKVRQAAQQLVSTTLILPMLKQMRQDPFRTQLFHGGSAEDMFGSQLDQTLADRITARSNLPVVDAVCRSIMRKAGQGHISTPGSGTRSSVNLHG